jgi:hypothetical protein
VRASVTLQTRGSDIVDGNGDAIRLKGVNIGGWLRTLVLNITLAQPLAGEYAELSAA